MKDMGFNAKNMYSCICDASEFCHLEIFFASTGTTSATYLQSGTFYNPSSSHIRRYHAELLPSHLYDELNKDTNRIALKLTSPAF